VGEYQERERHKTNNERMRGEDPSDYKNVHK